MTKQKDNLILVDVDGVLLNWRYAFHRWMNLHGTYSDTMSEYCLAKSYDITVNNVEFYVRMFNESAHIRYIPPLRDAVEYVRKLHFEHGYMFTAVTSLSKDPYAGKERIANLHHLFGETMWEEFIFLDCNAPKCDALSKFAGSECYWVEDKLENAAEGKRQGLRSLVMAHDYNEEGEYEYPYFSSWKDIYHHITGV